MEYLVVLEIGGYAQVISRAAYTNFLGRHGYIGYVAYGAIAGYSKFSMNDWHKACIIVHESNDLEQANGLADRINQAASEAAARIKSGR